MQLKKLRRWKMNEENIEALKKEIKEANWIVWSCGRSTDYMDEFEEEGSIENLIKLIDKYK